jgi:hypothetical protein
VKAKLVVKPEDWSFSNYLEWTKRRDGSLIDTPFARSMFKSPVDYEKFVLEPEKERGDEERIGKYLFD